VKEDHRVIGSVFATSNRIVQRIIAIVVAINKNKRPPVNAE
jgi:hypothetical protein